MSVPTDRVVGFLGEACCLLVDAVLLRTISAGLVFELAATRIYKTRTTIVDRRRLQFSLVHACSIIGVPLSQ